MKIVIILVLTFQSSILMAKENTYKIFHYNIKELDTAKINSNSPQLGYVKKILSQYDFDILSLNEIQYDLPNVPTPIYQGNGKNIDVLKQKLKIKGLDEQAFYPANTGNNSKPKPNGEYYQDPNDPLARSNADNVNFGTMPSQYSTAGLFKFKKINEVVITKLKWKEFNPNLNLAKYKDIEGNPYPEDMELFDKNFTDVTVEIENKEVHLIFLHTVPSFHFGNMNTVNYIRNEDQLKFLEWYLTGNTDYPVKLESIKPLKKDAYFIAMGDFNTAYESTENPGSLVLRRLFSKIQLWLKDPKQLTFTNEGNGYSKAPFRLMLDYIGYSNNIEIVDGGIVHPNFDRIDLGCGTQSKKIPKPNGKIKVSWKENGNICEAYIDPMYRDLKEASDHYPIWGHFKLK